MNNFTLTAPLSVFISLAAIAGVSLHDTKLDKLATSIIGSPAVMTTADPSLRTIRGDDHTHVERVNLRDINHSPRIMPRNNEQKKHLMQKSVPKGHQHFDGYCVPMP